MIRLRRKPEPVFKLSASDIARELAKLGAKQRKAELRKRMLATARLLNRTGAKSIIEPSEGWRR